MRRKVIAGNWKMNKDIQETVTLVNEIKERLNGFNKNVEVVICPPFVSLVVASGLIKGSNIKLGAQNMYHQNDGAFTGEVSARMLKAIGCEYVILGHSERRQYFKETNEFINLKVRHALTNNLTPIICVGETLEERESGVTDQIVSTQVKGVLAGLTQNDIEKIVIAYEPVWAIGTGKTATTEQANQVHKLIRKLVAQLYSWALAEKLIIQYGGSVNQQNAFELLSQSDIDGALVGGACLKADSFVSIIGAAGEVS
ncbi:MAG: triose-phosphate isomerase [Bacteroidota bacterium]|nr:triose-phosphate isomerase [Bacteroidota bacterium]